ncbi:MAG: thiamine phosphate synthase [Huintestinicola sp.]|uniref:thiamine phosphate synthase n=1 Tax=Huintestinicola sp. TaxID=2981661 RepID=UPI003EFE99FF
MFKVICVTQMSAAEDFPKQLEKLCAADIDRVILREKSLTGSEYEALAERVIKICGKYNTPLSLHTFTKTAKQLDCKAIHLSYADLISGKGEGFETVGVSVHSLDEAKLAEQTGASYITAGHIFPTDCKKDLPPRGTDFLREICETVHIPVYAIGGITPENAPLVKSAGASGVCLMSGLMKAKEPGDIIEKIKNCP